MKVPHEIVFVWTCGLSVVSERGFSMWSSDDRFAKIHGVSLLRETVKK